MFCSGDAGFADIASVAMAAPSTHAKITKLFSCNLVAFAGDGGKFLSLPLFALQQRLHPESRMATRSLQQQVCAAKNRVDSALTRIFDVLLHSGTKISNFCKTNSMAALRIKASERDTYILTYELFDKTKPIFIGF